MRTPSIGAVARACKRFKVQVPLSVANSVCSNPMLAETFEDVRMNFIAEKVRHNPLEIAYHAAGHKWDLTSTTLGRTKFWGK